MNDKMRVLIVDDDVETTGELAKWLGSGGHRVLVAHARATATALCQSARFDLLICHLDLPDRGGIDLLRHLRATGRTTTAAIALLPQGAAKPEPSEFGAHLAKPVQHDELLATIKAVSVNAVDRRPYRVM